MRIIRLIRDGADKILSILKIKRNLHGYKYCATVNIHNDISSILRKRRAIENTATRIVQKTK